MNQWITSAINFHDMLHRFWAGRVTRIAFLEANLIQQLMEMREDILFEVFLDLQKVYDALV